VVRLAREKVGDGRPDCRFRVVGAVAVAGGDASSPADRWVIKRVCRRIGSLLFPALGPFIGYVFPAENVRQIGYAAPRLGRTGLAKHLATALAEAAPVAGNRS
jgi:hypothetical protein